MIDHRQDFSQSGKLWIGLAGLSVILYVLWQLTNSIAGGSSKSILLVAAAFIAFFVANRIANDWRSGVSFFIIWLLFEDLIRKYMGNNMYIYFGKDVLVGMIYMSFLSTRTSRDTRVFRVPFKFSLGLFFILCLAQVLNPMTPSIFYGILGLKLYFYYVPLMFVGYELLRTENDLHRFLILNMILAAVISVVGILQTFIGQDFLNPRGSQEIDELGHLVRYTSNGVAVIRPCSVFVSDGRFSEYLVFAIILGLGTSGFLLLRRLPGRKIVFPAVGLVALATIMSGGRAPFVMLLASSVLLAAGMIWGAPKGMGAAYRLVKAIRQSFVFIALGLALAVSIFPDALAAHWDFYRETLTLGGEHSEVSARTWSYPLGELQKALADPDWVGGHGVGTGSLGIQYISFLLDVRSPGYDPHENGFAVLIQELGFLGPFLWLFWASSLVFASIKVMLRLKGTWAFPLGLAIPWFAFVLLFPMTWGSIVEYQNFIINAYLWLFVGILFRLPDLVRASADEMQVTSAPSS